MLPEAAGRGQHFQARGHSFFLYGPTLSRTITCLSSFLAVTLTGLQVGSSTQLQFVIELAFRAIRKEKQRANELVFTRQRKMY